MTLSPRMQNLGKMRNSGTSQGVSGKVIHDFAAKMMGKKRITQSIKDELKGMGEFYTGTVSKQKAFSKLKKIYTKLKEQGKLDTTKISVRKLSRSFEQSGVDIKNEISKAVAEQQKATGGPLIDQGDVRRIQYKLFRGEKLTDQDKRLLPPDKLKSIEKKVQAMHSVFQREQAEKVEAEAKAAKEKQAIDKNAPRTSVSAREDKKTTGDQGIPTPSQKPAGQPFSVPIQGGLGRSVEGAGEEMQTAAPASSDPFSAENILGDIPSQEQGIPSTNTEIPSENNSETPSSEPEKKDLPEEPPEEMQI